MDLIQNHLNPSEYNHIDPPKEEGRSVKCFFLKAFCPLQMPTFC